MVRISVLLACDPNQSPLIFLRIRDSDTIKAEPERDSAQQKVTNPVERQNMTVMGHVVAHSWNYQALDSTVVGLRLSSIGLSCRSSKV